MIGRIYRISPTETKDFNNRTFFERTLILDATRRDQYTGEETFPNFPQFSISGEERCAEISSLKEGDIVTVTFDLRGAKYVDRNSGEEKVYTRALAYKIEPYARKQEAPAGNLPPMPDKEPEFSPEPKQPVDDLPFE